MDGFGVNTFLALYARWIALDLAEGKSTDEIVKRIADLLPRQVMADLGLQGHEEEVVHELVRTVKKQIPVSVNIRAKMNTLLMYALSMYFTMMFLAPIFSTKIRVVVKLGILAVAAGYGIIPGIIGIIGYIYSKSIIFPIISFSPYSYGSYGSGEYDRQKRVEHGIWIALVIFCLPLTLFPFVEGILFIKEGAVFIAVGLIYMMTSLFFLIYSITVICAMLYKQSLLD